MSQAGRGARSFTGESRERAEDRLGVDEPDEVSDLYKATVSAANERMTVGCPKHGCHVHPLVPFLGCLILAVLQVMLLIGVGLEIKQDDYMSTRKASNCPVRGFDMSFITDFGLLAIVQVVIFSEMYWAVKGFVSVLGHMRGKPCLFKSLALIALFIQGLIAFLTSKVSLSVVVSNDKLTEKIFNSLALTFILEVDNQLFTIVKEAFGVQADMPKRILGKKTGGLARRVSLVFIALASAHQFVNVLFAVSTGWLPSTVAICKVCEWFPIPYFLNEEASGAKNLKAILAFCKKHDFKDKDFAYEYKASLTCHPIAASCGFLVIGFLVLAVFAKDHYIPGEDDRSEHSSSDETDVDEAASDSENCVGGKVRLGV